MQKLCFRPSPLTRNARRRQKHQRLRWMFEVCRDIASTSRLHFCRQAPLTNILAQRVRTRRMITVSLSYWALRLLRQGVPKRGPGGDSLLHFGVTRFCIQKTTPKSGPLNFTFSTPEPCDLFAVWGTFGAQCSAIFASQVMTSNLAANSTRYLQMGQAPDRFSTILAAS